MRYMKTIIIGGIMITKEQKRQYHRKWYYDHQEQEKQRSREKYQRNKSKY